MTMRPWPVRGRSESLNPMSNDRTPWTRRDDWLPPHATPARLATPEPPNRGQLVFMQIRRLTEDSAHWLATNPLGHFYLPLLAHQPGQTIRLLPRARRRGSRMPRSRSGT
jgi:hypothetical protein